MTGKGDVIMATTAKPWHRHYDHDTPTTIRYPRLAVHDLLGIPANAYPDKAALNFFGTEMTFWELRLQTLRLAKRLRAAGLAVDVYPGNGKLKAQFKYADAVKARWALVLGPDEAAAGKANVKELATGAETAVPLDGLAAFLKSR